MSTADKRRRPRSATQKDAPRQIRTPPPTRPAATARFCPSSTRFDLLQVDLKTLQRLLRHFVQAVPHAVENAHVFREGCLQLRQRAGSPAQFLFVVAVGLELRDPDQLAPGQMSEAGEVQRA